MQVQTLRSTPRPERLVCQCARGDYYDGFVAEDSFEAVMDGVSYKDRHVDAVDGMKHRGRKPTELDYKQYALLEQLFRHGHWGPFEHPQITLAVEGVSRVTMAQITRHRQVSFDVQSQRYVDFGAKDPEERVTEPTVFSEADAVSRETGVMELDGVDDDYAEMSFHDIVDECFDWYNNMVRHGMAKEEARRILPVGVNVNFTCSMNARTFMHIEDMRGTGGGDAQKEIQDMTAAMSEHFDDWMPMTAHLYDEFGPHKLAP